MANKTIVVRVSNKHQTGVRNRAGFTFTKQPSRVSVDAKQLKEIEADKYLNIVTSGNALKQAKDSTATGTASNPDNVPPTTETLAESIASLPNKGAVITKLIECGLEEGKDFKKGDTRSDLEALLVSELEENDPDPSDENQGGNANDEFQNLTEEELVAKLIEKGLKEGEDFTSETDRESLVALLAAE